MTRVLDLRKAVRAAVLGMPAALLAVGSHAVFAAPQPILIAPNSSFLLSVPRSFETERTGTGEAGWIEGGMPTGDSFRARDVDRDLEYRVMRALNEAEERGVSGRGSLAARQGDYNQMKRLAQEALSIVERTQIEWQRKRVSGNLRKSLPSDSVRRVEDSVVVLGGVAAAGLGAPLRVKLGSALEFESKTHLLDRVGTWRLFTPLGSSRLQVRLFDQGSQLEASHSYPLFVRGLSASVSALRMLDGASVPGLTDDERVQLDYTIRF